MNTIWIIVFTLAMVAQGIYIRQIEKEIEAIKSWYPFCQILKIKIPEKDDFDFGGDKDD